MEVRIICACRSETVTMVFAINGFLSSVVTQRQANACTAMTHPSFALRTNMFSTVQQGSAWDLWIVEVRYKWQHPAGSWIREAQQHHMAIAPIVGLDMSNKQHMRACMQCAVAWHVLPFLLECLKRRS